MHEPWFPPRYLLDLYDPTYDGPPMAEPNYREADVYTPAELRNMQARYKAMCTLLSKAVGRMLRTTQDAGLLDNSIVVFMSDHGMYLGERGRTGKSGIQADGRSVFPFHCEINRNLLVDARAAFAEPDHQPRLGSRLPGLVQAPDLMPTVLELCGIPMPAEVELEGRQLGSTAQGRVGRGLVRWQSPRRLPMWAAAGCIRARPAVTDGEWKLLVDEEATVTAEPELYRIADDPGESVNLIDSDREEARRIHAAMLDWLAAHEATPDGAGAA